MFRDELLENDVRRRVYHYVRRNPGLHLRELQSRLDIPLSTLDYHLGYMTRHGIIEDRSDGYHRQFYVKPSRHIDRATLAILRQKRLREIILLTLVEGKVKYQTLLTKMQIPASTLSFYLQRLVQHEILARHHVGREHLYTVTHPDTVKQLLITYQSSFLDRFVDNAIASWMELRD